MLTEEQKERIEIECGKLLELTMRRPVTVSSLAASPGSYIPILKYLMVEYEKEHEEDQHNKNVASEELSNGETEITSEQQESNNLPRLFSLTPEPSVKFRFISITPTGLKAFTTKYKKLPSNFVDNQDMFFEVFNFSKLNIKRYCNTKQ